MVLHPVAVIALGLFVIFVITKLTCANIRLRGLNAIQKMHIDIQERQIKTIMESVDDSKTRMDHLASLIQRVDSMSDELKNED